MYGVKLILEVGFLISQLQEFDLNNDADLMEKKAIEFRKLSERHYENEVWEKCEKDLAALAENAWKRHSKRAKGK